MSTWTKRKLGEICSRIDYGFTASASYDPIGPKFLRITDIASDRLDWATVPFCKIDQKNKEKYLLRDGDIVVARTGATTGYAKYIKNSPESIFASYLVRFRVNDLYDKAYVGLVIQSDLYKKFISNNLGGAAQPQANAQVLGMFEINMPDLPTQKQIASVLSSYEDLIENNNRRVDVLEEMAQQLYAQWFIRFHFPRHEKKKEIDNNPSYSPNPLKWKVSKLGDKIKIKKGETITKDTAIQGAIPVVAGGLMPAYYHNKSNTECPVITISASGANSGFVNLYQEDIWASDCSYIDKSATPFIYFYYLFLKYNQREIFRLQRGSAQPHVYPKDLVRLEMLDIPENLIIKFEREVGLIFEEISILKKQSKTLSKTRDLLIPRLVTRKGGLKEFQSANNPPVLAPTRQEVFKEAVLFADFISQSCTSTFMPTHLRTVKYVYFGDRFVGIDPTKKYAEQRFGPYNPKSTYAGGEKVALARKYVQRVVGGFKAGQKIAEINKYTYRERRVVGKVLSLLKSKTDNELELLATVDYIVYSKLKHGETPTENSVFQYISDSHVWAQKVDRLSLTLEKVAGCMVTLRQLTKQGLPYPY